MILPDRNPPIVVKLVRIDDGPGIDHGTARRKRKKDPIVELVGILK